MSSRYERAPRASAAGITTGAILVVIVAMAISVAAKLPITPEKSKTTAAIWQADLVA